MARAGANKQTVRLVFESAGHKTGQKRPRRSEARLLQETGSEQDEVLVGRLQAVKKLLRVTAQPSAAAAAGKITLKASAGSPLMNFAQTLPIQCAGPFYEHLACIHHREGSAAMISVG